MRTTVLRFIALVGLLLGALAFGTAASAAPGGNSANAKLCQKGGYVNLARADDTPFASEEQCTSYAAQGGTLIPAQPDLRLNTSCTTDAAHHTLTCTFTATNVGAGPAVGSSILLLSKMWTTGDGNFALASQSATCTIVNDPNNPIAFTFPQGVNTAAGSAVECAGPLGPGQQFAATVTVGIGTMTAGTPIAVSAAVDPNNIIAEFNEGNNSYSATVPAP
jgi:hypothetical protein